MLRLRSAAAIEPLAASLAELLADPDPDPMVAEWIAVPTTGMQRWLRLELARTLGAGPAGGDGVAANLTFVFPDALRQRVLDAGRSDPTGACADPWRIEQLVWTVLSVLSSSGEALNVPALADGATNYALARRLADVFDRYAQHRPGLLLAWSRGLDIDAFGRRLPAGSTWQPALWRAVRARLGVASPPERLPALLEQVAAGELELDLPERLSVFGISTLPGGSGFAPLLAALAHRRDVYCFLLDPSPVASASVRAELTGAPSSDAPRRLDDTSGERLGHPLLGSWARPARERAVLLALAESRGLVPPSEVLEDTVEECNDAAEGVIGHDATLLGRLQQDLRADRAPNGGFVALDGDRSIQIHACQGPARQVEVLRDAILHLLADDPELSEDDVVVCCPKLADFAPLIEAGFGPSATDGDAGTSDHRSETPRLAYRLADRSLREVNPVADALEALFELVVGRASASDVLDFLSLAPVARRFGFDADGLDTIRRWVEATNVRFGLSAAQRARFGIPATFTTNTWRAGLDQMLMGVAARADGFLLTSGGIAPFEIEGDDIDLIGRLGDAVAALDDSVRSFSVARSLSAWCTLVLDTCAALFVLEPGQEWHVDRLRRIVAALEAASGSVAEAPPLSLAEVRRVFADARRGAPGRSDFFRGGVTVTSMTPLRWLPFKVVCLLGLDEGATAEGSADGDDLTAADPLVGDRDPRADARQSLLEAVLAARRYLVVTRTDRDPRTNLEVPAAVAYAELLDTVLDTLSGTGEPEGRDRARARLEFVHPRQAYDERNFVAAGSVLGSPWSFDAEAHAGAMARRDQERYARPFLERPLGPPELEPVVTIRALERFLTHPIRTFFNDRLGIALWSALDAPLDELVVDLDGRAAAAIGRRGLTAALGAPDDDWPARQPEWWRYEHATGSLPAGGRAAPALGEVEQGVAWLRHLARRYGLPGSDAEDLDVAVALASGVQVVGRVRVATFAAAPGENRPTVRGPGRVNYVRPQVAQVLQTWLALLALGAVRPDTDWHGIVLRRALAKAVPGSDPLLDPALVVRLAGTTPEDRRAHALAGLERVVDCHRRALLEPIPLFSTLSRRIHRDPAARLSETAWSGENGQPGDGVDPYVKRAFGAYRLEELRSLPAGPHDPPGPASSRVERVAGHLWQAFEDTALVESLPADVADGEHHARAIEQAAP